MIVKDLKDKLKKLNIKESHYSLSGELKSDSIILYYNYTKWEIFYMDEKGHRNQLGIFDKEEDACNFFYELMIEESNKINNEICLKLDLSSPWKNKSIKDLEQKLTELHIYFINSFSCLEISFVQESLILRYEEKKWNLYIRYCVYPDNNEVLVKTYQYEDTMCSFLYNYCLQKLNFEKAYLNKK